MSAEPDAVAEIAQVTDHAAGGVALLPDVLRLPRVEALTAAFLGGVQALEDAAFPLVGLDIDAATGDALTGVGELVGLRRTDATQITDARYRVALRAWIRALRSSGTIGDVEAVVTILAGDGTSPAWTVAEDLPAGLLVTPTAALLTSPEAVQQIARATRAGGVRLQVVVPADGDAFLFGTDTEEPEADVDHGWSDSTQVTGGLMAGVVE
jgi:hypothetical protein